MRRIISTFVALVLLLAFGAGRALAGGQPVVNETNHVSNQTQTFTDVDPCSGAPAKISIRFSGVEHFVLQADGTGHFTETDVGTFSFDLLDAHGHTDGVVDATGSFTDWDGANGLFDEDGNPIGKAEASFTLNGRGTRADGTAFSFHNSAHFLTDDVGDVKLNFFKAHCG